MYWNAKASTPNPSHLRTLAILLLLHLCLPWRAQSQAPATSEDRVTVPLTDSSRPAVVKASLVAGGITVKAYAGKEVMVEARARSSGTSDRGDDKGGKMKRIPLTATGLSIEEENNRVRIAVESVERPVDLSITVPVRTSLILKTVNKGDISVTGVDGEIDVNDVNGSVTLTNVSGTAVAHALNGRVLVTFHRINREKPMAFSSLNGDIDVTFPVDLKANLTLTSDRGEVYSDFDIQMQAPTKPIVEDARSQGGKYRVHLDKSIHGTINGGGQELQFKNFQGSIYIRKATKSP